MAGAEQIDRRAAVATGRGKGNRTAVDISTCRNLVRQNMDILEQNAVSLDSLFDAFQRTGQQRLAYEINQYARSIREVAEHVRGAVDAYVSDQAQLEVAELGKVVQAISEKGGGGGG